MVGRRLLRTARVGVIALTLLSAGASAGSAAPDYLQLNVASLTVIDRARFATPDLPAGPGEHALPREHQRRFRREVIGAVRAALRPQGDTLRATVVLDQARLAYRTPPRPRRPLVGARGPGRQEAFVAEVAGVLRVADDDRLIARQPFETRQVHRVQLVPGNPDWSVALDKLAHAAARDVRARLIALVRTRLPALVVGGSAQRDAADAGAWVELCNDLRRRAPRLAYDFEALGLC